MSHFHNDIVSSCIAVVENDIGKPHCFLFSDNITPRMHPAIQLFSDLNVHPPKCHDQSATYKVHHGTWRVSKCTSLECDQSPTCKGWSHSICKSDIHETSSFVDS